MIAKITDPAQIQQPAFRDNLAAIETMQREAAAHGRGFDAAGNRPLLALRNRMGVVVDRRPRFSPSRRNLVYVAERVD